VGADTHVHYKEPPCKPNRFFYGKNLMKIKNKTIKHLEISLHETLQVKNIKDEEFNVLGENKDRLVIDDWRFSTLDTVKAKRNHTQFNPLIGDIHVIDYMKDKYFKDCCGAFVITVYHYGISKKILQNRINKAVNKHISNKIGCYLAAGHCNIKLN